VPTIGHEVQPQHGGVDGVDQQRVGEQPPEHRQAGLAESAFVVGDVVVIQGCQAGVEVVVAGVDELEPEHLDSEDAGSLGVRARVGAVARAGKDEVADDHEIALPLVDVLGLVDLEARSREPGAVGRRLGDPLGKGEPGTECAPGIGGAAVGREHHVRQPGDARQDIDAVPEPLVGRHEVVPLAQGEVPVDRDIEVHPGVDRVRDREEVGPAHEVAARRRLTGANGRGEVENGHVGSSWTAVGDRPPDYSRLERMRTHDKTALLRSHT